MLVQVSRPVTVGDPLCFQKAVSFRFFLEANGYVLSDIEQVIVGGKKGDDLYDEIANPERRTRPTRTTESSRLRGPATCRPPNSRPTETPYRRCPIPAPGATAVTTTHPCARYVNYPADGRDLRQQPTPHHRRGPSTACTFPPRSASPPTRRWPRTAGSYGPTEVLASTIHHSLHVTRRAVREVHARARPDRHRLRVRQRRPA